MIQYFKDRDNAFFFDEKGEVREGLVYGTEVTVRDNGKSYAGKIQDILLDSDNNLWIQAEFTKEVDGRVSMIWQ